MLLVLKFLAFIPLSLVGTQLQGSPILQRAFVS